MPMHSSYKHIKLEECGKDEIDYGSPNRKGAEMKLLSINGGDHTKLYVLSSHRSSEPQAFWSGHLSVRLMKLVKEPVCMASYMHAC